MASHLNLLRYNIMKPAPRKKGNRSTGLSQFGIGAPLDMVPKIVKNETYAKIGTTKFARKSAMRVVLAI